uniref:hypothetical protein n=1 Tax=Acetatifactor sp. TaxID=1872090 RepID=UPI0040568C4C
MRNHKLPYFAFGYPAELFDAPCNNLNGNEKLTWTAYTYLVDLPSRMNDGKMQYVTGFSWGYTENVDKEINILDLKILAQNDWEEHRKYTEL